VCGMSTIGVETTQRATRGSGRLTVTVARHEDGGGGLTHRRSKERRAAPTCPASRGRIGGEEGCSQSRVERLGAVLTGGGGRRRGLDEI
jgi:hypothetical protein